MYKVSSHLDEFHTQEFETLDQAHAWIRFEKIIGGYSIYLEEEHCTRVEDSEGR